MKSIIESLIKEDYQGWKNYATWGVALILDNNRDMYEYMQQQVKAAMASSVELSSQIVELGDIIREYVEGLVEEALDTSNEMAAQLINVALGEVDWNEIAKSYIEEERLQQNQPQED
jgi:hypothetical protein